MFCTIFRAWPVSRVLGQSGWWKTQTSSQQWVDQRWSIVYPLQCAVCRALIIVYCISCEPRHPFGCMIQEKSALPGFIQNSVIYIYIFIMSSRLPERPQNGGWPFCARPPASWKFKTLLIHGCWDRGNSRVNVFAEWIAKREGRTTVNLGHCCSLNTILVSFNWVL